MKRKRANNFYLPMEDFETQVLERFAVFLSGKSQKNSASYFGVIDFEQKKYVWVFYRFDRKGRT